MKIVWHKNACIEPILALTWAMICTIIDELCSSLEFLA